MNTNNEHSTAYHTGDRCKQMQKHKVFDSILLSALSRCESSTSKQSLDHQVRFPATSLGIKSLQGALIDLNSCKRVTFGNIYSSNENLSELSDGRSTFAKEYPILWSKVVVFS